METDKIAGAPTVLFVSHKASQCGVYEFGLHVAEALRASRKYRFTYVECGNASDYSHALDSNAPVAVIVNYHPQTMPWLEWRVVGQWPGPTIGIEHDLPQEAADAATTDLFGFHIASDPTLMLRNPILFKTGRLIPRHNNEHPLPAVPTIGSFGFGTPGKGFERLVTEVQKAFDSALIRLSIPASTFCDADGRQAHAIAQRCRSLIVKPGIRLEVRHDFLDDRQLLDFLGQNSLNAFLYEQQTGRGLSSAVDYALAVQRPIAITKSSMFRHMFGASPPITIEDSSLADIMARGITPLRPYLEEWTPENLAWDYERIVSTVLAVENLAERNKSNPTARHALRAAGRRVLSSAYRVETLLRRSKTGRQVVTAVRSQPMIKEAFSLIRRRVVGGLAVSASGQRADWVPVPANTAATASPMTPIPRYDPAQVSAVSFNRILDRTASRTYQPTIDYLFRHMPEVMSRKIPEANVQQAFVLDTVVRLVAGKSQAAILSVGSYEDTAAGCLLQAGYAVDEIDPLLNYDLATYVTKPTCRRSSYDVVFATSVIEHVADDGQFLKDMEELLAPGGVVVLTCDFNDQYRPGDRIPRADQRFYTQRDIIERLMPLVPRCELVDAPQWNCPDPDFLYDGCRYTFASLVFRRVR